MLNTSITSLNGCLQFICKELGFKKRKSNFYKPLKEGVFSTIGFGISHYGIAGHSFINVMVGVIYEEVELLSYQLTGYNRLAFMQPQIGTQIGYLMPENKPKIWEFVNNTDNTMTIEDLLYNLKNYAIPYQKKYQEPSVFFDSIDDVNIAGYLIRDRYLPILYYLRGDKQSGLKVIEEAIERQLHPNMPIVPSIRGAEVELYVGPAYGRVDPSYLTFAENYRNLPDTDHKQ